MVIAVGLLEVAAAAEVFLRQGAESILVEDPVTGRFTVIRCAGGGSAQRIIVVTDGGVVGIGFRARSL